MRKGLAGLVLGLALVVASISWSGFILSRTVLDPNRSERLADQLFENDQLRAVLVTRLASSVSDVLPGDVVVPTQTLETAADLALDNPAVQGLVRQGIVETHQAALNGQVEPVVLDGAVLGEAFRSSLIQATPSLESVLPQAPAVSIELPTSGLNFLGTIKTFVDRFTVLTGAAALIGGAIALVVTSDRPSVLRRVAFWAFGASLFWLIVGFGVPRLAGLVGPASSAIITAMVDVFFGAMIPPAVAMGVIGGGLLVLSAAWAGFAARRPANVAQPARVPRGQGTKARSRRIAGVQTPAPTPQPGRSMPARPVDQTIVQPRPQPSARANPQPTAKPGPGTTATPPLDWAQATAPESAAEPERRWVEGIGYVDEPPS